MIKMKDLLKYNTIQIRKSLLLFIDLLNIRTQKTPKIIMTSISAQPQITQEKIHPLQKPLTDPSSVPLQKPYPNQLYSKPSDNQLNSKPSDNQLKSKPSQSRPQTSEQVFFQVMDQVDEYDRLLKEMNQLYTEGMLTIANVKFLNPYSSLSTKGYKPTPAITKVLINSQSEFQSKQSQQNSGQMSQNFKLPLFTLVTQTKNIKFTNSAIDSINTHNNQTNNQLQQANEQTQSQPESQSAHSSQSTANQLYSFEEQELIIQEEQTIEECRKLVKNENFSKEEFLLGRFNIQSQTDMIVQGMTKFDLLLQKVLQIAQKKLLVKHQFDCIGKSDQKSPQNNHTL